MKTGSAEMQAHESCAIVTGTRTRRDPLSAVSPELQFEYQDSEITVTKLGSTPYESKPNYLL